MKEKNAKLKLADKTKQCKTYKTRTLTQTRLSRQGKLLQDTGSAIKREGTERLTENIGRKFKQTKNTAYAIQTKDFQSTAKSVRIIALDTDSVLTWQTHRTEEVDTNDKESPIITAKKNFNTEVNFIHETLAYEGDVNFDSLVTTENESNFDIVGIKKRNLLFRDIKAGAVGFNKTTLLVRLTDINRSYQKYLEKIDEVTFLLKPSADMMAMKAATVKVGNSKPQVRTEIGAGEKVETGDLKEDEISLKELKSMIAKSDVNVGNCGKHSEGLKVSPVLETPKKGRKSKSAENSPTKTEKGEKKSLEKKSRKSSSACSGEKLTDVASNKDMTTPEKKALVTADSASKQTKSSSPRRPKKDKSDSSNSSSEKGQKGKRAVSESPSPRRKLSPKKNQGKPVGTADECESKKVGSMTKKSCKSGTKKTPNRKANTSKKNQEKQENTTSPEKSESAVTPRSKKKTKLQTEEKSTGKKKQSCKSVSSSPKGKAKAGKQQGSEPSNGAVRVLEFDDENMKEKILNSAKINLPSDFKYEYKLTKATSVNLHDLINKVNCSLQGTDENLTALFGKAEELEFDSSPEPSENIDTSESDKTLTEFDTSQTTQENKNVEEKHEASENKEKTDKDPTDDKTESDDVNEESKLEENTVVDSSDCYPSNQSTSNEIPAEEICLKNNLSDEHEIESPDKSSEQKEKVSVFDMFGLKLKKTIKVIKEDEKVKAELEISTNQNLEKEVCEKEIVKEEQLNQEVVKEEQESNSCNVDENFTEKMNDEKEDHDDDVMIISAPETKASESIVISDEEDETVTKVDRSGYLVLNETVESSKCKPKFTTVNNVVDPKPLEILSRLEQNSNKETAFCSSILDEYLLENKENLGNNKEVDLKNESKKTLKEALEKAEADIDEVDGHIFVSFETEQALHAHVSLEKKTDWLSGSLLRKLAQLKEMKERQHDVGSKRVTDVKSLVEQKQSFRGVPMRMIKYQKLLRQELEFIITGKENSSPGISPMKTPQKTTDITKIKGWKTKFQNAEELQEATGINISESGKIHWKTEERLLKNLDPEDVKDIGLDLKKKRRKIISYTTNKRKSSKDGKSDNKEYQDYEYELDESVVTERDVYNEDDEKPPPDKIPYAVKYLSQHKYGARKLFVKKMKLDAEDERILKKLGTQKLFTAKEEEEEKEAAISRGKKSKMGMGKLTQSMAIAAVSALNKKLILKAKKIAKDRGEVVPKVKQEAEENEGEDHGTDIDNYEDDCEEEVESNAGEERVKPRSRASSRRQSLKDEETGKAVVCQESKEEKTCTEPGSRYGSSCGPKGGHRLGCRYGCICHLCKLSDSSEEKEPENKPPCDKEYCKLGCICDSIDTNKPEIIHCRKQGCMFGCKCPPKQPKPDIPRDHSKKKRRGRQKKKKSKEEEEEEVDEKGEQGASGDDTEDWEPPSKRKRGSVNSRFANLPRRETTYRLAKNLDAVSRKAMEVYASSEMFVEQKARRRKSDQLAEDGSHPNSDFGDRLSPDDKTSMPGTSHDMGTYKKPKLDENTGILEIIDSSDGDETMGDGSKPCSRTKPYDVINKIKSGTEQMRDNPDAVISLVDSDKEDDVKGSNRRKFGRSSFPSTSAGPSDDGKKRMPTVSEKMGLTKIAQSNEPKREQPVVSDKFKTQMVCLKARKKPEDKSSGNQSQISLLEIISNCQWESHRNDILSKISHAISKDPELGVSKLCSFNWYGYKLQFLAKSDQPAVIPPELKSKLPEIIYSIRIRLTPTDLQSEVIEIKDDDAEKKQFNLKLQKKLIDKIKFAQKLRNLIIAEEQKGVKKSQFSVSREGIERALKKYKLQLWKSYTGTTNLSPEQLKEALRAAKASTQAENKPTQPSRNVTMHTTTGSLNMNFNTMARITANQGLNVVYAVPAVTSSGSGMFVPLGGQQPIRMNIRNNAAPVIISSKGGLNPRLPSIGLQGKIQEPHGGVLTLPTTSGIPKMMTSMAGNVAVTSAVQGSSAQSTTSQETVNTSLPAIATVQLKTPLMPLAGEQPSQNTMVKDCNVTSSQSETPNAVDNGKTVVPVSAKSCKLLAPKPVGFQAKPANTGNSESKGNGPVPITCVSTSGSQGLVAAGPLSSNSGVAGINGKTNAMVINPVIHPAIQPFQHGQDVMLIPVSGQENTKILKGKMVMMFDKEGGNAASPTPVNGSVILPLDGKPKPVNPAVDNLANSEPRIPSPEILNNSLRLALPSGTSTDTRIPSPELLNNSLRMAMPSSVGGLDNTSNSVDFAGDINSVGQSTDSSINSGNLGNKLLCSPSIYPVRKAPSPVNIGGNFQNIPQNRLIGQPIASGVPVTSCQVQLASIASSTAGNQLFLIPVSTVPRFAGSPAFGHVATPVTQVHTSPSKKGRTKKQPQNPGEKVKKKRKGSVDKAEVKANSEDIPKVQVGPVCLSTGKEQLSESESSPKDNKKGEPEDSDANDNKTDLKPLAESTDSKTVIADKKPAEKDMLEIIDDSAKVKSDKGGKTEADSVKMNVEQTAEEADKEVDLMMMREMAPSTSTGKRKQESPDMLDVLDLEAEVKIAIGDDVEYFNKQGSDESDVDIVNEMSLTESKPEKYNKKWAARQLFSRTFEDFRECVYKYRAEALKCPRIKKNLILDEGVKLIGALKERAQSLEESYQDGIQYRESLQSSLKGLADDFIKSGVPEGIIRNFLKSVQKAALTTARTKIENAPYFGDEDIEMEENDTELVLDKPPMNSVALHSQSLEKLPTSQNSKNPISESGFTNLNISGSQVLVVNRNVICHKFGDAEFKINRTVALGVTPTTVNSDVIVVNADKGSDLVKSESSKHTKQIPVKPAVGKGLYNTLSDTSPNINQSAANQIIPSAADSDDDEDEIRSSTGDIVLDHDHDFQEGDEWGDYNQNENTTYGSEQACETVNVSNVT